VSSELIEDREQTILRLWNDGLSSKKLMKAVKCSQRTLSKLVAKFEAAGLVTRAPLSVLLAGGRDWPKERTKRLKELYAEGLPLSEIAAALGVTRGAVAGQAAKIGLSRDPAVTAVNKAKANVKNAAHLRAMNEGRRGQPRLDLRGPRKPRNASAPSDPSERKQHSPRGMATSYVPTEAELAASKSLLELGAFHCRFPILSPSSGLMDATRFCGCAKYSSAPYCDRHMEITHNAPQTSAEAFVRSLRRIAA
jgi:hypothetical protein